MKKIVISIILICCAIFGLVKTYGATSLNLSLETTKNEIQADREIYLSIKLENFSEKSNGINAYKAKIVYDKEIFEEISTSNFICQNGWFDLEYNTENGQFVAIKKVGIVADEEVVQIRLNVKEEVKSGDTTVIIKDIVTSQGKEDIECASKDISINIIGNASSDSDFEDNPEDDKEDNKPSDDINDSEDNEEENKPSDETNNPEDNKDNNNSNDDTSDLEDNKDESKPSDNINNSENTNTTVNSTTNTVTNTNVDNTVSTERLPSTGKKYTGVLIGLANIVLITFAILCYKKQKAITKKDNKQQKNILKILIILSLIVPMATSIYAAVEYINKGDINKDNKIDYSDTRLLEQYIIEMEELSEEQIEIADMNNDGKITVTDLSLLVIKVEKWLNYELEVKEVHTEKNYYEKNEEVSILLNATVNYGGRVKKVVINDEEYDVEFLTTDEYRVQVKASEKAGIQEFKFKKALLDNEKYVQIDDKVEIDVLKKAPIVENYEHSDDLTNQKVTIKFDVIDDDKAIENINAVLVDEANNIVYEEKVKSGTNELKIEVEEAKTYILKIVANYDRDTNKLKELPTSDNKYENVILFEKEVVLVSDYDLKISNLVTYKNDIKSKYFDKNEEIKLGFESSNKTKLEPSSVEIEGKEYYTTKNNNLYFINLEGYSQSGIKEIKISSVTLSNGKQLDILEDNSCKIDVLKGKPEIIDFKYQENNNGNYVVSFNLKDNEKTIQANSNIIITTQTGNEVLNSNVEVGENSFEFEISSNSQKYVVKIIADYDLDTNTFEETANEHTKQELLKEEIDLGIRAIQMKDISSIEVYQQVGESVEQVKSIDVSNEIDVNKYIVKVNMKDMPSFYSNIKEANIENDILKFTLDYENIVQYEGATKQESLEVAFGSVEKNIAVENIKTEQINKDLYIPDYERLQSLQNFDSSKEILYANLYKLMPFYDAKYYVLDGKEINNDNILNTKVIKEILAINKDGKLTVALTNSNYKDLSKLKVIFEDNTIEEYNLSYNNYYGNVVSYKIDELGLIYNFDKYILNDSSTVIADLITYIEKIDYTTDLDLLTEAEDSRLYKDYFNETTSNEAEEMVLKLLANASEYTLTIDNKILNTKVKNELISAGKLKEYIYAYNYYKRWYSIEIEEIEVNDIIMFEGQLFADSMTVKNIINEVMISTSNKNTNSTQTFYANNIAKYTGYANVGEFLDYLITTIGGYKDPNDWFTDNYKGIVHEVAIDGKPQIEYRAWRQLKNRADCVLPVLTLPANSAYILSSPTQFLIGAQRTYIVDPNDKTQNAELRKMIENYAQNIKNFYTTASGYIPSERFNLYTDAQIDHRFTKNAEGGSEYQSAGTTEEPFHKNFNEAVGWWAAANGSAAYANGSTVYWNVYSALTSFSTWSHETGHNQDGKIFLNGNGRRGWAEDYADGNITQGGDDGGVNFNLTYNYDMTSDVTTNLTPKRINTPEKIHSYYKGMFEALDLLDYIEAKAFLTLTPEEQSKVAVQVYYPNKENATEEEKLAGDEVTGYRVLDKAAFEKMNLQTIEDLWDNQIIIKPSVTDVLTVGTNKYGGSTIYTRNWYQPHNDNGRPDSYSFKYLAWEMLGVAGYYDGYITYYSNVSANDLDAIRKITKDDTMTWKKYKLNRYQTMQNNWHKIQYLNADNILEQYIQALKTDAANSDRNVTTSTNVKRMNYHYLKRATNDFEAELFGTKTSVVHIKTAKEFQTLITNKPNGYYMLDADIDMSSLTGEKAIIAGTFTGSLDGNGYKITGNTLPIFENVKYSYISNLSIENTKISTTDKEAGALAKTMYYSSLTNVHVENVDVTADSRAGGIVGYSIRNFINQCSATNATVVASGNAVGAFMGEINNSYVTDCYSTGYVKGRQDMGGFVGWADSTTITNCYSAADTQSTASSGNGGFIGQAVNTTKVKNCVALGNVTSGYKFDGRTSANLFANFENNYEYELAVGTSTLTRTDVDFKDRITVLTKENAYSKRFYTEVLGWDSNVWEFLEEKLPTLKN